MRQAYITLIYNGLPLPQGIDYQQGELLGFANLREYCFWRDNYTCQWCKGNSKISAGISYKQLKLLEKRKSYLVERREAVPLTTKVVGFPA